MARNHRLFILGVFAVVGIVMLAAAILLLLIDANVYRSRLPAAAPHAMGMEVSFAGRLSTNPSPGSPVTIDDVQLRSRGLPIVSANQATTGIAY